MTRPLFHFSTSEHEEFYNENINSLEGLALLRDELNHRKVERALKLRRICVERVEYLSSQAIFEEFRRVVLLATAGFPSLNPEVLQKQIDDWRMKFILLQDKYSHLTRAEPYDRVKIRNTSTGKEHEVYLDIEDPSPGESLVLQVIDKEYGVPFEANDREWVIVELNKIGPPRVSIGE